LGLTLTRRIVEQYHKGIIYVKHSELGKGTTFKIELRNRIASLNLREKAVKSESRTLIFNK